MRGKNLGVRAKRIQKDIQRIISNLLTEVGDVRVQDAAPTVSQVQATHDLSYVKIYVSMMNQNLTENDLHEVLRILNDCTGYFRSVIGKSIKMRSVPQISFFYDDFFDEMKKAKELLNEEKNQLEQIKKSAVEQDCDSEQ